MSQAARDAVEASGVELLISAVVPWELANKLRIGKWPAADAILDDLGSAIAAKRLTPLPISLAHSRRAGLIPSDHRDPFDRLLAAQAEIERVAIITADPAFATLGVDVMW